MHHHTRKLYIHGKLHRSSRPGSPNLDVELVLVVGGQQDTVDDALLACGALVCLWGWLEHAVGGVVCGVEPQGEGEYRAVATIVSKCRLLVPQCPDPNCRYNRQVIFSNFHIIYILYLANREPSEVQKQSYKKSSGGHQAKKKKRGKNLSPRNRKACHSVSTALLKSVAVNSVKSDDSECKYSARSNCHTKPYVFGFAVSQQIIKFVQEKAVEATKQNEEERKKTQARGTGRHANES
jgi:hypothetical protein